jgi:hypothetical protein
MWAVWGNPCVNEYVKFVVDGEDAKPINGFSVTQGANGDAYLSPDD